MENRLIKFRVWNKNVKSFIKNYNREGIEIVAEITLLNTLINSFSNLDNYVIQQFTGLLDFKGVQIYEGDILKDGLGKILGSVRYKFGEWGVGRNYSLVQFWGNETYKKDTCKLFVIGNILENPDYLKE